MIPLALFLATSMYELVTVPLYWRIIYVLIFNKELSSPFFRFLLIISICENIHYMADVAFYRLPLFEPTSDCFDKSPTRVYTFFGPFLVYFCNYPVYFLQVAISLNRLTSVWFPVKNKYFWQRWWIPVVVVAFIVSAGLTFHRSPFNAVTQLLPLVKAHPELGSIPNLIKFDYYTIDTNLVTGIYNIVVVILSLIINTGTLVKIMQMKRVGGLSNASTVRLEINLFIIVVWMMCSLLVLIAYQGTQFAIRNYMSGTDQEYALYELFMYQPLVDDIGSVSHPWVLIAMSGQIRNAALPFWKGLFKKSKPEVIVTTISVTNVVPSLQGRGKQISVNRPY